MSHYHACDWTCTVRADVVPSADLDAALAEVAALKAQIGRIDLGNPLGWTPEQIQRNEEFNASLQLLADDQ